MKGNHREAIESKEFYYRELEEFACGNLGLWAAVGEVYPRRRSSFAGINKMLWKTLMVAEMSLSAKYCRIFRILGSENFFLDENFGRQ